MTAIDPETARKLFAQSCDFVLAAAEPAHFPKSRLPEIAFIGRSNVGKSSLINALTGRKIARASNTPGRTQQIVFFNLFDRLMLVDLPGYGHADAPREQKDRWNGLVQTYLRKREALKCVCLLMDGRHEAKANDLEMMKFLDRAAMPYRIVLTKIDQIRSSERETRIRHAQALAAQHPAAQSEVMTTSAENGTGIPELRTYLAGV
ncbi:MAG: ribosome biogenesis GTP-binding protein YihA/YsxC [Alphaproteobacteria bacterium]|nr:ribosome biogenesis GTP-binding protein YihA/YsxC [Alphaproteobacteria bacterium]